MWTSLVVQWLRILLSVPGTRVRSLVREDPPCLEKLGLRGNDCPSAPRACAPHRKPPPRTTTRDCLHAATKTQHSKSKLIDFLKTSMDLSRLSAPSTIFTIYAKSPLSVGPAGHTHVHCTGALPPLGLTFGPFLMSHFFFCQICP